MDGIEGPKRRLEPKEDDVPRNDLMLVAVGPVGVADGPMRIRAGSDEVIRELSSLGLTREASLGIMNVLLRRENPTAAADPSEW